MSLPDYIPDAVKKLKLVSAFKGYNPGVLDFIEVSHDNQFMIVDNAEGTCISKRGEDYYRCCLCVNPNNNEIVLLPLDKKLIKQRVGGMADGAVFDEQKFVFLEFKDQAQGNSYSAIEDTYTKASSQLTAALHLFEEKLASNGAYINITASIDVSCHIIVSDKFPRASAIEQNMRLSFAMSNNGVGLSFEKEILFNDRTGKVENRKLMK
jgi:hypothetical protein